MVQFVDEATISVKAGKGGHGCLSFRREKCVPLGGPDGGDGGDGGSVYLVADQHLNTLAKFRYARQHKARNGQPGMGRDRRGKSAEDLLIPVPFGTKVFDCQTEELIGDLTEEGQRLCVAQGGFHGLGNARFKSSINRAPRQTTQGSLGEERELKLELNVLADVGLCGLPNAGKSTLIRAVSNATPKVADYPFTTLEPHLGVVSIDERFAFVMADIPGLIEGASQGVGLGVQFLKHLQRTNLLLHVVDIASDEDEQAIVNDIYTIEAELKQYNIEISQKPRWLVFNKLDCLDDVEMERRCQAIIAAIDWQGPVYKISAIGKQGTRELCVALNDYLLKQSLDNAISVGE